MISSSTKVVGLIGNPVEHSVSPAMHNAAFEELGMDYVYLAFKVSEDLLSDALHGVRALGMRGVNVTIPHKSDVMDHLDQLDELAQSIEAVNTINREAEGLKGFNTDGIGAMRALLEEVEDVEGREVLLLGAGGAARAVAFTLAEAGANLTISNRTNSKAKKLVGDIEEKIGRSLNQIPQEEDVLERKIKESEILINSTSVGMHPQNGETIVKAEQMHSGLTVMDIVYNPLRTRLLREAEKAGAKTISGLGMLVHQGVASFEIWTGREPPVDVMRKAARKALEGD